MSGFPQVSVDGPLVDFAAGFAVELAGLGYSPQGGAAQLRLMQHVSRWLAAQGLGVGDLTEEVVERFVAARRERYRHLRSARAVVVLLGFLRRVGAAPQPVVMAPVGSVAVLTARFGEYLRTRRGLAADTVVSYLSQAGVFLRWRVAQKGEDWAGLDAGQVRQFIVFRAQGQGPRSVQVGLNALRALLRWMGAEGLVRDGLAEAVGPVAAHAMSTLPKTVTDRRLNKIFARAVFRRIVDTVGLPARPGTAPARLHDLRHTFAVDSLIDAHRDGVDVDARVAALCTYLGHSEPAHTYWYLTVSPQLMALVAQRMATRWEGAPR